jgi:hypothetical protein
MDVSGQRRAPAALLPRKYRGTPRIEGCVGTSAGLDAVAKKKIPSLHLPGIKPRNLVTAL